MIEVTICGVYAAGGAQQESEARQEGDFSPVVVLKALDQEHYLAIPIGRCEGWSIASHLRGIRPQRPMTHDLTLEIVKQLDGQIEAVHISWLGNKCGQYIAILRMLQHQVTKVVDCRASDAIALAIRVKAPIFVAPDLLQEQNLEDLKTEISTWKI